MAGTGHIETGRGAGAGAVDPRTQRRSERSRRADEYFARLLDGPARDATEDDSDASDDEKEPPVSLGAPLARPPQQGYLAPAPLTAIAPSPLGRPGCSVSAGNTEQVT